MSCTLRTLSCRKQNIEFGFLQKTVRTFEIVGLQDFELGAHPGQDARAKDVIAVHNANVRCRRVGHHL